MKTFGRNLLSEFHVNPNTLNLLAVVLAGMAIAIVLVSVGVMMMTAV